ncbi:hypothetical protein HBI62_207090 [Parastagonospora nodorum]|nr:hypothetical protein HBI62_207090 [Parastagonospora nodorum]
MNGHDKFMGRGQDRARRLGPRSRFRYPADQLASNNLFSQCYDPRPLEIASLYRQADDDTALDAGPDSGDEMDENPSPEYVCQPNRGFMASTKILASPQRYILTSIPSYRTFIAKYPDVASSRFQTIEKPMRQKEAVLNNALPTAGDLRAYAKYVDPLMYGLEWMVMSRLIRLSTVLPWTSISVSAMKPSVPE